MSQETRLPAESGLPALTAESMLELYREMYKIRRVEELAAKAYTQRKILGFCHLYIGQEAVAVGAAAAAGGAEDYWLAAYREHGHALAKGVSARKVMAELFGKADGCSHGLGGSMHMFDRSVNFMGGYGIVGAHVPLATGVAWAIKRRAESGVCVVFFGEGAANQGAFFEALALAQLYKLPVVFICENNFYAMGTSVERASAVTDMSRRAAGVGMVSEQVKGFDVRVVRERVGAAARFAREGSGPVLLELVTYRYRGHSMSDPAKYRSKDEVEDIKNTSDCLQLAEHHLKTGYEVTQDAIDAVREEINALAQDAWDFAEASPLPDPADLYKYTYAPGSK
jgi:pyruvate dehydrogenase E1 component alpha subunit